MKKLLVFWRRLKRMDQLIHTVRRSNWINIIQQCQDRPAGITAKQWLAENGIFEKPYYYWPRKIRREVCEQECSRWQTVWPYQRTFLDGDGFLQLYKRLEAGQWQTYTGRNWITVAGRNWSPWFLWYRQLAQNEEWNLQKIASWIGILNRGSSCCRSLCWDRRRPSGRILTWKESKGSSPGKHYYSFLTSILNVKYVNSSALHRVEQEFRCNGVNISKQTMSNWIIRCAEKHFAPFVDCISSSIRRNI